MPYQIVTHSFFGPLDLLLYLVRRNEVDIRTIGVSDIADQFLETLDQLQEFNIENTGEFLVMAATLMEIKVKNLLPSQPHESYEVSADPRKQLIMQLLEYRKFKDAAGILESTAEAHHCRIPRSPIHESNPTVPYPVRSVELWDLVSAFARLMRETHSLQPTTITIDDTPQEVYERQLVEAISRHYRIVFRDIFQPPYSRAKLIGLFLAVLELIKRGVIGFDQSSPFEQIWLYSIPRASEPQNTREIDTK
jgi:segregation and condensation protein A